MVLQAQARSATVGTGRGFVAWGVSVIVLPDTANGTELRRALDSVAASPHLSFLMGAGASSSAGLPGWTELLHRLLVARKLDPQVATNLLSRQDALFVAEAAFSPRTSASVRHRRIYEALYGSKDAALVRATFSPTPIHHAVAEHAVSRGRDHVTLMTLNYDDLLEEAVAGELLRSDPSLGTTAQTMVHGRGARTPVRKDKYQVHHMHGLLPRQAPAALGDDLILTLTGYNRLIDDQAAWQFNELQNARMNGPLVMVGTSFSDPDVRIWLHRLQDKLLDEVILLIPRQGLGLGSQDLKTVTPALLSQWGAVDVTCLVLEDYSEVAQTILELRHVTTPGYRPPRERVAEVFQHRMTKFATTQRADAKVLSDLADAHLSPVLGSPVNLTLWLLEGQSQEMVRWATGDRIYTSPTSLMRAPATLESPWVAAQALCSGLERGANIAVTIKQDGHKARATGRWQSVLARPVTASRPGGPPVPVGALSSASTRSRDDIDMQKWAAAMDAVADVISRRLSK
jgi:hypothetical protein